MNEFLEQMREEMLQDDLVQEYVINNKYEKINKDTILRYKMDFIFKNMFLEDVGSIEVKEFIIIALNNILTEFETGKVKQFNMYKKDKNCQMDVGIRLKCNGENIYYLRKEEGNFERREKKDIIELLHDGWILKSDTIARELEDESNIR